MEGLSTAVPTAWLTSASGDAGKDGGESEQEWRCAHGRLQGGGGQQVGHKLVSWLFLTVERRRQTSGVLYFNMCPVSLGRCLPTKGTVMISVWQEREVKSASFILRPLFSHLQLRAIKSHLYRSCCYCHWDLTLMHTCHNQGRVCDDTLAAEWL